MFFIHSNIESSYISVQFVNGDVFIIKDIKTTNNT